MIDNEINRLWLGWNVRYVSMVVMQNRLLPKRLTFISAILLL